MADFGSLLGRAAVLHTRHWFLPNRRNAVARLLQAKGMQRVALQFWHVEAARTKADREARAEARRRLYQMLFPSDTAILESKRWGRAEERHAGAGSTDRAD